MRNKIQFVCWGSLARVVIFLFLVSRLILHADLNRQAMLLLSKHYNANISQCENNILPIQAGYLPCNIKVSPDSERLENDICNERPSAAIKNRQNYLMSLLNVSLNKQDVARYQLKCLATVSSDPWVHLALANMLFLSGLVENAEVEWEKSGTLASKFLLDNGDAFSDRGDLEKSVYFWQHAYEYALNDVDKVEALRRLGSYYLYDVRLADEAIPFLEEALRIYPQEYLARVSLVYAYLEIGEYEESVYHAQIAMGQAAAKRKANRATLLRFLGASYNGLGKYEQATNYLEESLQIDPENVWGYFWLAEAYQAQGDDVLATEAWQNVIQRDPHFASRSPTSNN